MLMRQKVKNKLYDRLHKGTVMVCMGVTLIGFSYIGYFAYTYYTKIKPELVAKHLKAIEEGTSTGNTDLAKTITT